MAEIKTIEFEYKEVAEALIRYNKITNGLWGITIKFGIQGANIGIGPDSDKSEELTPAAIVPILKIGLQRFDKPNNLTVDASTISQKKSSKKS